MVGEWEWIETTSLNRLDGSILVVNPQTENKLVRYNFHQNSELNVYDGNQILNLHYKVGITTGSDGFDSTFWLVINSLENGTERRKTLQFDKEGQLIFYHVSVPISQSFKRLAFKQLVNHNFYASRVHLLQPIYFQSGYLKLHHFQFGTFLIGF